MAARSPMSAVHTVAAAVLLCTFVSLLSYAQADCGGFALTCDTIIFNTGDGVLSANCKNGFGGVSSTSINLNAYISNSNGKLVDGSDFIASCENIQWYNLDSSNEGIAAECIKDDKTLGTTTTYNVQRRVSNLGGVLSWNIC